MRKVVELRVHGVGGTPKEDLLGVAGPADLIRVAGEDQSAFYRRLGEDPDDPEVEGYTWGALTTGALSQPLWIFLLPFTLVNVAGWMLPAREDYRWDRCWGICRALVMSFGATVTATYTLGMATVLVKQVSMQWKFGGRIESPLWQVVLGVAAMVVTGMIVFVVAQTRQRRYEQTQGFMVTSGPNLETGLERRDGLFAQVRTLFTRPSMSRAVKAPFSHDRTLSDKYFWYRPESAQLLLLLHSLLGAVLIGVVYFLSRQGDGGFAVPDLTFAMACVSALQLMLIAALSILNLPGFLKSKKGPNMDGFRWFGPAVACSTAMGLAGTLFSGLVLVVHEFLNKRGSAVQGRPDFDLSFAYGWGSISFALTLVLVALFLVGRTKVEKETIDKSGRPPLNQQPAGRPPDGLPLVGPTALALRRSFSAALRQADILLTVPALIFFPVAASVVGRRLGWWRGVDQLHRWRIPLLVALLLLALAASGALWAAVHNRVSRRGVGSALAILAATYLIAWVALFQWEREIEHGRVAWLWPALGLGVALAIVAWASVNELSKKPRGKYRRRMIFGLTLGMIAAAVASDRMGPFYLDMSSLAEVGGHAARLGVTVLLAFLLRHYFKLGSRRKVGILWDVLTFWPRRFHPLGVRPYAEKAVPELLGRIAHHIGRGRCVLLSAHSQGTVIAFSALAQLNPLSEQLKARPQQADETVLVLAETPTRNVSFLTYGSPLSQLHSRFFPAYFNQEAFKAVYECLAAGSSNLDEGHPLAWRNFYRTTDYIGQHVDLGDASDGANQQIPDPAEAPDWEKESTPLKGSPDPFRTPWVDFNLHSFYNSERPIKNWIAAVRNSLCRFPN